MPSVAVAVARSLADAGVRRCFTVPGESFLGLLDAIAQEPRLELVPCRHEAGAAFMAEAEGKLTGRPALALASRSPGACNLSIGVQTAQEDATPLVAILGQVESHRIGTGALQEIDLAAFYTPIAKAAWAADSAAGLHDLIMRALRTSVAGRPGPVAVSVPADLWNASWTAGPADEAPPDPLGPKTDAIARVAGLLERARHPVAIVGGGARGCTDALTAFAERFDVGVYTAFRRQHLFPNDHPNYLGHLALGAPGEVLAAGLSADLVVLVGARVDDVTGQDGRLPPAGCRVLSMGPETLLPAGTEVVDGEVAAVLTALADAPGVRGGGRWAAGHAAAWAAATEAPAEPALGGIHPARAVLALRAALPAGAIVTNDAGNFSAFLHRHSWFGAGGTMLGPANGAMGYAVPAAVAAKLVEPDACVVAVVGDGGVLMTGQELETAVRLGLKIVVVVFQNGFYGTIAMHQARSTGRMAGVEFTTPDLSGWARGLGADAWTVEAEDELEPALRAALGAPGPSLLAIRTDPDVIAPGATLSGMLEASNARFSAV